MQRGDRARWRLLRSAGLALAIAGMCGLGCSSPSRNTSNEAEAKLREDLVAWFECEECDAGQLEAVLSHGEVAVPTLVATLEGGPSPAVRERYRRSLEKSWERIEAYRSAHPGTKRGIGREDYVNLYLGNFEALYRVRAARALGTIRSGDALEALRRAEGSTTREDVMRAVRAARTVPPRSR